MKPIKIVWVLASGIPVVLLLIGYIFPSPIFSNQEKIQQWVASFGSSAPLVFILVQIAQVVVTPFSHYVVGLAGGYLFGSWLGFLYNWIGRVIGTLIAFYISRYFGRKLVRHVISEEKLQKYDLLMEKGKVILFLMYFLPLFPDDELAYLAGASKLKPLTFFWIMAIGHIGGSLSLAYAGSGMSTKDPLFWILTIITIITGVLFALLSRGFGREQGKRVWQLIKKGSLNYLSRGMIPTKPY